MKTNTETLQELFVEIGYAFQVICDDYADKNNIPTGTVDDYLKDDENL